jgi:periplasmic protein CpxP/Spy
MADTETSGQLPEAPPKMTRRPRRWRGALAGVLLLGLGAVGGYAAGSMHGPWWILNAAAHGHFDPARMGKHIDRRVDRVLDRVNASQEQRDKVTGIFKGALGDVTALGVKPWETREKFIALLRADTIDPAAFEALRAQQISTADAASKRIVQAMTEAAQVLTPEQRRELADRWERHGRHFDRDRDQNGADKKADDKKPDDTK